MGGLSKPRIFVLFKCYFARNRVIVLLLKMLNFVNFYFYFLLRSVVHSSDRIPASWVPGSARFPGARSRSGSTLSPGILGLFLFNISFSDLLFFPSTSFRFPISFFPIYSFLLFLSSYFLFPIFYSFFRFPIPILYYFLLVKGLKCESDMTHDLLCVYI